MVVDDEPQILLSAETLMRAAGISNVITVGDSREVLPLLGSQDVGALVLDISMPELSGSDLHELVARDFPDIPVIFMTAMNDLETAVSCMKAGAFDYLVKPVDKNRFITSVTRALEMRSLQSEISSLKDRLLSDQLENASAFSAIITRSKKMRAIFQYAEVISDTRQPVLITGETGTGKELIARAIHETSGLEGPFVPVNVAGLDDTVFSDTLFGHRRGAFTGADEARAGLIAEAEGGTLFLDEIGDMSPSSQVKLMRLIQERTYYPLGSDLTRKSNARILVATNRDVHKLIETSRFRRDLYYRLRAHLVHVPPLRERMEDIPLLLQHFLEKAAFSLGRKRPSFPKELLTLLSNYRFPGNVRELELMVFDATARCRSGVVSMKSFRDAIGEDRALAKVGTQTPAWSMQSDVLPTLREAEDYLIAESLRRSNGNQRIAAALLGLTRQALNKRLTREKKK